MNRLATKIFVVLFALLICARGALATLPTGYVITIPNAITTFTITNGAYGTTNVNDLYNYPPNWTFTSSSLTAPTSLLEVGTGGGTTYAWVVTGTDTDGEETLVSNEVTGAPLTSAILTWTAPTVNSGAPATLAHYNVYRGTAASTGYKLIYSSAGTTTGYTDTITAPLNPPTSPPCNYTRCGATGFLVFDWGSGNKVQPADVRLSGAPSNGALGNYNAANTAWKIFGSSTNSYNPQNGTIYLGTVPLNDILDPYHWKTYPLENKNLTIAQTSATRYFGLEAPQGIAGGYPSNANVGTILVDANTLFITGTPKMQPEEPIIRPCGGKYPSGSVPVTMYDTTTSAAVMYTTDGTYPTFTNTAGTLALTGTTQLYSAGSQTFSGSPTATGAFTFAFTPGTSATVYAIAVDVNATTIASSPAIAVFNGWSFAAKETWFDEVGAPVNLHALGAIQGHGGGAIYYFGLVATAQAAAGSGQDIFNYDGVHCVTTPDGLNNLVDLGKCTDDINSFSIQRFHPIYCPASNSYVAWAHLFGNANNNNQCAAVFETATLGSKWRTVNVFTTGVPPPDHANPPAGKTVIGYDDDYAFTDNAGNGYVVYAYATTLTGSPAGILISKLTPDFKNTTGNPVLVATGDIESPVAWQARNGNFVIQFTAGNYYNSTSAEMTPQYVTCSTWNGTWSAPTNLFASDPIGTAYNAQWSCVLPLTTGQQLLIGDWWANKDVQASTFTTIIETLTGTTLSAPQAATINIPAGASIGGNSTVGSGSFHIGL